MKFYVLLVLILYVLLVLTQNVYNIPWKHPMLWDLFALTFDNFSVKFFLISNIQLHISPWMKFSSIYNRVIRRLGGENGQFWHNRASSAYITGNENFTKGNNWDPN